MPAPADPIAFLRRLYDAYNRADFDAVSELNEDDVELVPPGGQAAIRGRDAIRAWMEPDAFDEQTMEPLEFVVAAERVFARQRLVSRGSASGMVIDVIAFAVWSFGPTGRIARIEAFLPHEEAAARAAAGLAAEPPRDGASSGQ